MKKVFFNIGLLLIMGLAATVFNACDENNDDKEKSGETPIDNTVYFPASGKTKILTFANNLAPARYECDASWITIVPQGDGAEYDVTTAVNTTGSERRATITFKSNVDDYSKTFPICQYAKNVPAPTSKPYTLGDIYYENGVMGVVYKISNGGNNGMIISMNNILCQWSADEYLVGCLDHNNGANNMNTIKQIAGWETRFPAFKWCEDLNTGGVTGWYLPASNELKDLYTGFAGLDYFPGVIAGQEDTNVAERAKFNHNLLYYDGSDLERLRAYGASDEYEPEIQGEYCSKAYFGQMYNAAVGGRTKTFTSRFHAVRAF